MASSVEWDHRFLRLAREVSSWSQDPSTKVGCVIIDSKRAIIGCGYNGFSKRDPDRLSDYLNRETKLLKILHAESNAIDFSDKTRLSGATVYTYPFMPCSQCTARIIQNDIVRIVSLNNFPERWEISFTCAREQIKDSGLILSLYDEKEI